MSATPQNNDNQEIDLSLVSKKIASFFDNISTSIFKAILFVKKRLVIFIILFVTGAGLGYFLDTSGKIYENKIIVSPNFGSVDYLYAKVDLLQSKIRERDTVFLKSIGVKKPSSILQIEIEPVIDIYNFVASNTTNLNNAQNTQNFELIKLLSEDGDVNKVISEEVTSKNYGRHTIRITTKDLISNKNTVDPLLLYLNQNEYYQNIQKTFINNIKAKMEQNIGVINQIDTLLGQFSSVKSNSQKSDKLVFYNEENTQLNDIIQTKNNLMSEIGIQKMNLISFDTVINENSSVLNVVNKKGLNNKMKFILPIFFIFVFIGLNLFRSFYKNQTAKLSAK
jgi:hypothetical protein